MMVLVVIPTYNETRQPARPRACRARPSRARASWSSTIESPDGTGAARRCAGASSSPDASTSCIAPDSAASAVRTSRVCSVRWPERRRRSSARWTQTGRTIRKYLPAMIDGVQRPTTSSSGRDICTASGGELAAAPHHPERVRQPLHPRHHGLATDGLHERLSAAGAARRWRSCRSTASSPTATRSWSRCSSRRTGAARESAKCRSSSSSDGWACRSCRAACCSSRALTPWRLRLRSLGRSARERTPPRGDGGDVVPAVPGRHGRHVHGADRARPGRARPRGPHGAAVAPALDSAPPRDGGVTFHLFRYAPMPSLNVFGYAGALRGRRRGCAARR